MAIRKIAPTMSTTEVLDRVLDKGIVIEAEIRIAVAGIELITVNALVRIASFEAWDRYVTSAARARVRGGAPGGETPGAHRVRLRCERGCTFERRASALVIRDGTLVPQRCAVAARRRCAVSVV